MPPKTSQQTLASFFSNNGTAAAKKASSDSASSSSQPSSSQSAAELSSKKRKSAEDVAPTKSQEEKENEAAPPAEQQTKSTAMAIDSETGEDSPVKPVQPRSKKRRVIEDEDEDEDEEPKKAASTTKKPAPAKAKSPAAEKKVTASAAASSSKAKSPAQSKGKAGPAPAVKDTDKHDVDVSGSEDGADASEEENEAEEEMKAEKEEGKAHKQLAAIFLKQGEKKKDSGWKADQPVPYKKLCEAFAEIEATTKRLAILDILTNFFRQVIENRPSELLQTVYLCINRLCPDYEGLELGLGESLIIKAIARSTGRKEADIKKDLTVHGDLGVVAINSRKNQPTMFKPKPLDVPTVFKTLREIAGMSGNKSQDRKIGAIVKLLTACVEQEPKYLIRSLEGKLRIGLAERTVVVALGQAAVFSKLGNKARNMDSEKLSKLLEEGTNTLKAVQSELPCYDKIVPALLEQGIEGLRESCKLTPGIPLKPMLAKPTKAIGEVLDRFEGKQFTCEYKYDGERAQVHYLEDGTLAVFSRNSENMSVKYPDLVQQIPRCIKEGVKSFVLDAEAVAWKAPEMDAEGNVTQPGKLLPFQELSKRKRKDVKAEDIKVKVKLFGFDLLYLNGEPLLQKELKERRRLLAENFKPVENEFEYATHQDCSTVEEIQIFLDASVKEGCEGLMVKMSEGENSTYEPSRRSMNWLKLKKDYIAGTGDSLDLVVMGGYYGKGKRTNVYGAFLLACYDMDTETYQSVCKIGTGFSEADLEAHYNTLKPLEVDGKRGYYDVGSANPDIYFEPKVVWEVLTADLSLSPVYAAAKGLVDQRGISLRFPRFIRIRDDKGPEDSTTPEQIQEMYQKQATASKGRQGGGDEDDGFW
ncbi:ATP-dependent DNA ligase Cdc17 [Tilletia horrida]|uniref:DNA ligase n=1 Tax=Tilletia horrida TaxID=155126 RepID=A0AAN6GE05_9BASI|nr:ATP-dependent DNA ligase Cdc17 [Tilletia horrida]